MFSLVCAPVVSNFWDQQNLVVRTRAAGGVGGAAVRERAVEGAAIPPAVEAAASTFSSPGGAGE